MRSLFDNLSSSDDQNLVGVTNGRKTVGHDDACAVLCSLIKGGLDGSFTSRIQGTTEKNLLV